ncbi:YybS family protein [Natranaerobius trueperi]|uniref:DUF2232 domain-containing protein n=1 Tax=Natranaerobius trueperi TaxID=759412 RepID=A0A226BYT9_9FIRM|nr:DUF2232 domain-containing protein [Natranaerobius trueperi]OWZ83494.1 hypothetical protein CDO51_08330 [Natranaerobius trueperi]
MTSSPNTKYITEGAILTALFVVLSLAVYVLPIVLLSLIILPIPYVVIFFRTNVKIFLMSALIGLTILVMIVDPIYAVVSSLIATVIGGFLGYALNSNWSAIKTLLAGSVSILTLVMISLGLTQIILEIDIVKETVNLFEVTIDAQEQSLENMGVSESQIKELGELGDMFYDNIMVFFPSGIITASVILGFLQVSINIKILEKLGYAIKKLPKFRNWRFPIFFTWFYVLATLIMLLTSDIYGYWGMLSANLFFISNWILLVHGLATIYWYFKEKKNLSNFVTILIIILGLTISFLNMVIVLIGISDQLFNFREALSK